MNKTAIKNFAIWARNKLIASVEQKAMLVGITEAGIADKLPISTSDTEFYDIGTGTPYSITGKEIQQRKKLVKAINDKIQNGDYKIAFHSVVEEVAYTWFNRLIALRFMEVNDYLEDDMRVLSSVSAGKIEPDVVTTPFDYDFDFTAEERSLVMDLQANNKIDELFRIIFIKECNALNKCLPYLFEKTADYSEFLLTISVTDIDGVVYKLVHDIPEEDFNIAMGGQVEIIGWMYQYYNTEPKAKVFNRPSGQKIKKEEVPAATQLFTPDWIVRYMVENSLGRLWLEGHPSDSLKSNWIYYLEEAQQEPEVQAQLEELRKDRKNIQPEDIKIIDPCMGSGHILVYAFDVLMDIYREQGYVDREAAQSIIENNLYGLDIDQRAFQLAYFAVMMKGRQYDRRILGRGIEPNLCAIEESNGLEKYEDLLAEIMGEVHQLNFDDQFLIMADELIDNFHDAKEYGSILNLPQRDYDEMLAYIDGLWGNQQNDMFLANWLGALKDKLPQLVKQAKIMSQLYDVVVTNPPYMGLNNGNSKLVTFVKQNYSDSKSDLSTIFMEKTLSMLRDQGYLSMINIPVWMFITSFLKLRENISNNNRYINMLHLGRGIFGSDFGTTCFVIAKNYIKNYIASYRRLFEKQGAVDSIEVKERRFLSNYGRYYSKQDDFSKIPDNPVAYWVSNNLLEVFKKAPLLSKYASPKQGMSTCDINRFAHLWYEVDITRTNCLSEENYIWVKYNKGGTFRRWYGNREYVVFWNKDGHSLKDAGALLRNRDVYFKSFLAWTKISSAKTGFRVFEKNSLFDGGGGSLFPLDISDTFRIMSFLNTKVCTHILNLISPTLNYNENHIGAIPIIYDYSNNSENISKECFTISKNDWDTNETSWDFLYNPLYATYHLGTSTILRNCQADEELVSYADDLLDKTLSQCYEEYKSCTNEAFGVLKSNEEELNHIFIDIYGLQDELTPEVSDKDVTVASIFDTKEDIPESYKGNNYILTKEDVIKNLISYAVGCLFGRYSLKKEGLIYAGGDWSEIAADNWTEEDMKRGIPDNDNVIPITDEAYLEDDITGRFVRWMGDAFGTEHLEENLTFVADALNVRGGNSRDIIRNYFLNGFFADHFKKYQKRPIYWLYDSGKNNGFKALVYMHRYDADTTGRVRMDYLHRLEQIYGDEINRITVDIQESTVNKERAKLQKRLIKLQKQVKECREYDENIAHLALERIEIDLDDGVKMNYDKVQTDRNGKKYQILAKVKL